MRKLVIGCGYLGGRVAATWQARGDEVHVLTRSESNAHRFSENGWHPIVGDVLNAGSLRTLPAADTVLYAVGFDRAVGHSKRAVYVDGLRNVLSELKNRCGRLIYISSTSVYGQDNGEWIDESSATEPRDENGRICLDAELLVRENFASASIVLRLSGLYGPGRLLTRIEQLRRGEPLTGNPEAWLNLIHVDDAVRAVIAAEERGQLSETYLVSDGQPLRRRDYYSTLATKIGAPPLTFSPPSEGGAGGGASQSLNKRCLNHRLRDELQVDLQFPTISAGLAALPELSQ